MTPFEKAGYTKDTKFRVLHGGYVFKRGDIVKLSYDDGSNFPRFHKVYDPFTRHYIYLPGKSPTGIEFLEVVNEEGAPPKVHQVTLMLVGGGNHIQIRDVTSFKITDEFIDIYSDTVVFHGNRKDYNILTCSTDTPFKID